MLTVGRIVTESTPTSAAADLAIFEERFASVRPRLLAISRGLVGTDAAEDVVQDAYLRARGRFHQLRDASLFDAWVSRIVVNLCFNRHRDRRRLFDRLPVLGRSQDADRPRDAGLRELIERLPPRDRTLVVLYYGHGYQVEEIAAMLGLTSTNARTILFRARAKLAAWLREADR
jgi:RNA polymerase sigma-70 factor (ECF subfamily)